MTVRSCARAVVFTQAPRRVVSNDVNLTEMLLALGLRDRMIGYTGISGWQKDDASLREQLAGIPELARRYPALETLVAARADFYLAGWNYGMHVGGAVTPDSLARFGIASYELSESCAHVMHKPAASLDDVYRDLDNLGRIFDVAPRAGAVIAAMRARIDAVRRRIEPAARRGRVFVYDSGEDKPFTAGGLAMPNALIGAAGGRNVMEDVAQSWAQVSWESVVKRDPEWIVVVDYGAVSAAQKIRFLTGNPALANVDAIRKRRFIVLPYDAATPGVRNAQAIETLARALHPGAFAASTPGASTPRAAPVGASR